MITKVIPQLQKVYIDEKNEGTITCPNCQKSKRANFTRHKHLREVIKVKCGCGCAFGLIIDQRKYYRKKTKISGSYAIPGTNEAGGIIVEDLSFTGVGFQSRHTHKLQPGDLIEVRFILDNHLKTEMCRNAIVRRVKDKYVGAEFCDDKAYDKELGFYLMQA